jgi:hypothetical protein
MRTKLKGKVTLLFMVLGMLLAVPAVALADNVQNDVSLDILDTDDRVATGEDLTVGYRITANSGDGQAGCNVSDTTPATVTINKPSEVNVDGPDTGTEPDNPATLTFNSTTGCGVFQNVRFSSDTPGNYPITVSVSDAGTGTYNTSPAIFTLHVSSKVVSVVPPNNATNVPVGAPVVANFSGAMNSSSFTSDTFKLVGPDGPDAGTDPDPVSADRNLSSDGKTATLDPTANLADSTKYTATLEGGWPVTGPVILDATGNPLLADYTWSFTTGVSNTAPTVPGAPTTTSNPNQGEFTLTWDESTDAQNNPITYTLQHKDADDADFSEVAPSISGNSYTFTGTSPEDEGTWTYRVRASDGSLSSNFSADSSAIKVDQSRPNSPLANVGTPDYTALNGDKWFKNSTTVSFTENGDPTLDDGSTGSGVVSVSADQSRSMTGALNYSGTATDDVGLVSLPTTGTVYVDNNNPAVNITCPSSSVILGSTTASANWTASDVGSGLATAASGSVALTTSDIAASLTATAPTATDNVGLQSAAATCNYSVAAGFNGFLQPIDGDMVNAGKTGRVYPIKWQLKNNSGALISDALGLSLAQQMSVEQKGVPCVPDQVDSLETEVAAGSTTIRYDEASDQFIFNYKAPTAKGCYDLNLKKADGVNTKTVKFTFTK